MKKTVSLFALTTLLSSLLLIPTALAIAPPTLNPVASPVNATKALLSGTTEPGAKITVSGGPFQIAPVYADANGNFEIQVGLAQENTNIFFVKATDADNNMSEQVQVTIVESDDQAAEVEGQTNQDRTAPDAPDVTSPSSAVDMDEYTLSGSAEPGSTIYITGGTSDTTLTNSNGEFEVTLPLEQNATNNFTFSAKDAANNLSPGTTISIIEESAVTPNSQENDVEEEEEETEGEEETTTEPEVEVISLSDIAGHWSENYILELVSEGYASGYEDGTFQPDRNVTRAEFTKIVLEAFNRGYNTDLTDSYFPDVDFNAWYGPYIETAFRLGIIDGYDDGTFGPDDNITRGAAMKILLGIANIDANGDHPNPFTDVPDDEWFTPYVLTAAEMEIVSGYDDGSFGPAELLTRGQVAKIVMELKAQL